MIGERAYFEEIIITTAQLRPTFAYDKLTTVWSGRTDTVVPIYLRPIPAQHTTTTLNIRPSYDVEVTFPMCPRSISAFRVYSDGMIGINGVWKETYRIIERGYSGLIGDIGRIAALSCQINVMILSVATFNLLSSLAHVMIIERDIDSDYMDVFGVIKGLKMWFCAM